MKKAQVTLFVIIGLMLVLAFVFLLSLKPASQVNGGWDQNKIIYELESGLLKEHVDSCISKITTDGLELIGQNGGFIYDFEGGTIPLESLSEGVDFLNFSIGSKKILVGYGLRDNDFCPEISYIYPKYPFLSHDNSQKSFAQFSGVYSSNDLCAFNHSSADYDGVFGKVSLSKLCAITDSSSCRSFASGEIVGLTLESQLEDYVLSKLSTCVDFSEFQDDIDGSIEIEGDSSVDVIIRDDDVFVKTIYPFKITYKNSAPVLQVFEYGSYMNVRLGSMYNYLYDVLSKEARNPFYNMNSTPYASSFYKQGFVFNKLDNPCTDCGFPNNKHDIVEVYDTESIVKGKSFLFRVAVQNRRPIVQYIGNKVYDLSPDLPLDQQVLFTNITVFALDPDDSSLEYFFLSEGYANGWRENDERGTLWLESLSEPILNLYMKVSSDFGEHPVSILVKDSDGYFDYEWFNITIIDNSLTRSPEEDDDCLSDCRADSVFTGSCEDYCTISANSCISYCSGNYLTKREACDTCLDCDTCVNTVYYSKDKEQHPSCSDYFNIDDCKSKIPDCFWVTQKTDFGMVESSCVDDSEFYLLPKDSAIN